MKEKFGAEMSWRATKSQRTGCGGRLMPWNRAGRRLGKAAERHPIRRAPERPKCCPVVALLTATLLNGDRDRDNGRYASLGRTKIPGGSIRSRIAGAAPVYPGLSLGKASLIGGASVIGAPSAHPLILPELGSNSEVICDARQHYSAGFLEIEPGRFISVGSARLADWRAADRIEEQWDRKQQIRRILRLARQRNIDEVKPLLMQLRGL